MGKHIRFNKPGIRKPSFKHGKYRKGGFRKPSVSFGCLVYVLSIPLLITAIALAIF